MITDKFIDSKGKTHILKSDSKVKFRPAVYVLVKNDENKYLLILNSNSNKWEISGGGLKVGEDFLHCGIRELKEETGYDIQIDESSLIIDKWLDYSIEKGEFEHCLHYFYLGNLKSNIQIKQNFDEGENILEVKWFSLEELKKVDIVYWQKRVFNKLIERIE